MPYFSARVPGDFSGAARLDKFVASLPGGMNRSKLKAGVAEILVNGRREKLSYKVRAGDQIDIEWEDNVPEDIVPEDIPLRIVYEDGDVCVVDKEQGMVTHPACGNWSGTLVNALLYHWGREKVPQLAHGAAAEVLERRRPGIVHRLDKDTSGLIITAKNRDAEEWLQGQFRRHRGLVKEYIAICAGRPPRRTGVISTQVVRDPRNRRRFKAVTGTAEGKRAVSAYRCVACYGGYSLMRVRIATGRTHQIRVHMKFLNCPVLGDSIYSRPDREFPRATLMLHARRLSIRLPGQDSCRTFVSPTPERFVAVMRALHRKYPRAVPPEGQ